MWSLIKEKCLTKNQTNDILEQTFQNCSSQKNFLNCTLVSYKVILFLFNFKIKENYLAKQNTTSVFFLFILP